MRYIPATSVLLAGIVFCSSAWGWDGFDSDTADLVEILPDRIPNAGETIDVRNYENDQNQPCLVESVTRNRRTIEVVVRNAAGKRRILVMEGR